MLFLKYVIFLYETGPKYLLLISTEATDGLVLQHQGISRHNADYSPMRFHGLMRHNSVLYI